VTLDDEDIEQIARRAPLALRREDAARAISVSDESFDRYVRPSLPVVRLGAVRVYPVVALKRWLLENADAPTAELEREMRRS
jgi:hypothetical protein